MTTTLVVHFAMMLASLGFCSHTGSLRCQAAEPTSSPLTPLGIDGLTLGLSRTGERYSVTPTTDEPRSPVSAAGLCWAPWSVHDLLSVAGLPPPHLSHDKTHDDCVRVTGDLLTHC